MSLCLSVRAADASAAYFLPSEQPAIPVEEWVPELGDAFIADTKNNMGYLVHTDGRFTEFLVASGQRRTVRYIGRTYNAATPARRWVAMTKETKGDRTTFGKDGTFIRLFMADDTERTAYGIHAHRSIDVMLAEADRFRSMGCILVSYDMLDLISETFELNNQTLPVVTVYGFGDDIANGPLLLSKVMQG